MAETTPRIPLDHHLGGAALGTVGVVLCGMLLSFSLHSIYLELSGAPHGRILWLVAVLLALGLIGGAAGLSAWNRTRKGRVGYSGLTTLMGRFSLALLVGGFFSGFFISHSMNSYYQDMEERRYRAACNHLFRVIDGEDIALSHCIELAPTCLEKTPAACPRKFNSRSQIDSCRTFIEDEIRRLDLSDGPLDSIASDHLYITADNLCLYEMLHDFSEE